ncbi:hypothetical protein NXS19_004240 [Fusarium pseudograminearum]|nr:hypothetical protein NXS19_004240 [Fusarium pseudograminearum]
MMVSTKIASKRVPGLFFLKGYVPGRVWVPDVEVVAAPVPITPIVLGKRHLLLNKAMNEVAQATIDPFLGTRDVWVAEFSRNRFERCANSFDRLMGIQNYKSCHTQSGILEAGCEELR